MRTIATIFFLVASVVGQDPITTIPQGNNSTWVVYTDRATLVELDNGQLLVRQTITVTPSILHAEWTDRSNTKHSVDTNCANITIEECLKRHLDTVTKYQASFPPQ